MIRRLFVVVATLLFAGLYARAEPLIIAHRGASGYLPEHTLEAYAVAYAQGADYLEPDVVMTGDGVLICAHEVELEATTDVETKFPDRRRDDGHWYAVDLTLDEIRTLQRTDRDGPGAIGFTVATFDELLALIAMLNERTGRRVGVIPEPKQPGFHRDAGHPMEEILLERLRAHGYTRVEHPAIIQCFDLDALQRMRNDHGTELRLVYLTGEAPASAEAWERIAAVADGIGPSRKLIEGDEAARDERGRSSLVREAKARGLSIFPYTFQDEPEAMARFLFVHGVDGVFTDYPDVGRSAVAARAAARFDVTIDAGVDAPNLGAGQGAAVFDGRLYLYGDGETGIVREYDLDAAKKGMLDPTGRSVVLMRGGVDLISHPTGFAIRSGLPTFMGDTVGGMGRIYTLDWATALTDGDLDRAVRNAVLDDLARNGCRPEYVRYQGRWVIASSDYGDDRNEVRLYDPAALATAEKTSDPGVLIARFPCGPWVQTLHWMNDLGVLVLVQNQIAGLRYRLTFVTLDEADLRTFAPVDLRAPVDELEGFVMLGEGRCLFFSSSRRSNVWFGRIAPRARVN